MEQAIFLTEKQVDELTGISRGCTLHRGTKMERKVMKYDLQVPICVQLVWRSLSMHGVGLLSLALPLKAGKKKRRLKLDGTQDLLIYHNHGTQTIQEHELAASYAGQTPAQRQTLLLL